MSELFKNINEKNIEKLLKSFESYTLNFKKNTSILTTMKNDNIIAIIVEGYIQIIKNDYNGNRTIIEELTENEIFGSLISSINSKEIEILTKEDSKIIVIDYDSIMNLNDSSIYFNTFLKNLTDIVTKIINQKNKRIEILTQKTIRNKLLKYFSLNCASPGSKHVYLPFTFTDLADYLAVDRCAMSREIKYLKDEGFIDIKEKRITLLYK